MQVEQANRHGELCGFACKFGFRNCVTTKRARSAAVVSPYIRLVSDWRTLRYVAHWSVNAPREGGQKRESLVLFRPRLDGCRMFEFGLDRCGVGNLRALVWEWAKPWIPSLWVESPCRVARGQRVRMAGIPAP